MANLANLEQRHKRNKTMKKSDNWYLGLDIGTDSVGYAVTDEEYRLLRFKGESMWGSALFDPANTSEERRKFRTARRRLDRRQLRVKLLQEFFERAINDIDPRFFTRLREAALFAEDKTERFSKATLFNDAAFKDADFHGKYPTIHHLIVDLMNNPEPHDCRLVYMALAWLLAHRGHFLSEISLENVSSFDDVKTVYDDLMEYMARESMSEDGAEYSPMWDCEAEKFGEIIASHTNITAKKEALYKLLFAGKKPKSDDTKYDRQQLIALLCGSSNIKADKLFKNDEYADVPVFSLEDDNEKLELVVSLLGDDGELVTKAKALYDWAVLKEVRKGARTISEAKVAVYEQHRKDLRGLKEFLRKTDPKLYKKVFVLAGSEKNYTAYVNNHKDVKNKAKKEDFCDWLRKTLSGVQPPAEYVGFYADMMERLETNSFLPKQVDGDNRVIPHQLYQVELRAILDNAKTYLPFLEERDEYGSVADKIESIFAFRVPYFVGPLVSSAAPGGKGKFAWMKRKADGMIRPWNFADLVDLDASEDEFIRRMTGRCTYVPGEEVLPLDSLLYREFTVLNEINPLKICGASITVGAKNKIVNELFKKHRKVSTKSLSAFLRREGMMKEGDTISGIDETIKSTLSSYHDFKGWLDSGDLAADDVESIILRSACTEDSTRFVTWLKDRFGTKLDEQAVRRIARFKYSEFGRLSKRFLDGIEFECKADGERGTVMDFMRSKNVVLMELLSDKYTLAERLDAMARDFYCSQNMSLEKRLDEMYVSSAVKRQIYRALDIVKTVVKVMGSAPKKVFVEMARGGTPDQKGKRTKSRLDQLNELYRRVRDDDAKAVDDALSNMGDSAQNRLQADALFLWTLQFGKCIYCGRPLPVEDLKSVANIDHIHPQSKVKDDSIMNNKVLCCSSCNDRKSDVYPVPDGMRLEGLWRKLHDNGLMTDEKFRRLMRREAFTDEDLQGFINRQLVETRQTTKAIFTLLSEKLPQTEIVAVKAGNVSDFRHEFKFVKSRAINDLHHAKDAYLDIVIGNVYHEKFSKQYFRLSEEYSMKTSTLFGNSSQITRGGISAWNGAESLRTVRDVMARNDIHLTKYAFYVKGGLFDQMPKGPGESVVPRKKSLCVERYGGYAKPAACGYLPVSYLCEGKHDVMIVPIDLLDKRLFDSGRVEDVVAAVSRKLEAILGKSVSDVVFPLGLKLLKVNTILMLDHFPYILRGKSGGGSSYLISSMFSLVLGRESESYVKRLESLKEKIVKKAYLTINQNYDKVSQEENLRLYDELVEKMGSSGFASMPASQYKTVKLGRERFAALGIKDQITVLLNMVQLLKSNRAGGCDLTLIGGVGKAGVMTLSSKVSNWKKTYKDVRIVHVDFSGMFKTYSRNLLELV